MQAFAKLLAHGEKDYCDRMDGRRVFPCLRLDFAWCKDCLDEATCCSGEVVDEYYSWTFSNNTPYWQN